MLEPARRAELEGKFGLLASERLLYAVATGDRAAEAADYLAQMRHYSKYERSDLVGQQGSAGDVIKGLRTPLAVALSRSGRAREAEAIIAPTPETHDAALRARALTAAYAGKHAASDALFSRAIARTPSLPGGNLMWGEALLLRGDTKRAIEQAELANRKGPQWAEPLKLWGDALVAGRRGREAEKKYAAAAERTPRWGKLHLQWANVLWMIGQRQEAVLKLRQAAAMDLSVADRQLLNTMWRNARAKLIPPA
jgi:tetratricopeptide (TPR) repeat protein